MERKNFIQFLFVVLITTSIISCKSSGPNLTGEWHGNRDYGNQLSIKMDGENYIINFDGTGGGPETFAGKYENGIIKTGNTQYGDITYSKDQDKLYFDGVEFSRK